MKKIKCNGFTAAGLASGIKKNSQKDLGLIFSTVPANAAGVFTKNMVKAAPVILDMERIKSGRCRAFIANSGNANCCTGEQGILDAKHITHLAAQALKLPENMILMSSTGVIGETFPVDKIVGCVPDLVNSLSEDGFDDFAKAIMTTDTVPKAVSKKGSINGNEFTITGIAKGSGMIHPDMATLLCFICTDIDASSKMLKKNLLTATDRTLNRITIDGDTSTNDSVLIMANGVSGAVVKTGKDEAIFLNILDEVLMDLAKMLVKDAEGATKLVKIEVRGALSDNDARRVAVTVADSSLVKTAFYGEDANWGRILAAAGRADVFLEQEKTDIYFDDVLMFNKGKGCGKDVELRATNVMKKPEYTLLINLNSGNGTAFVYTCDMSLDYIKINADYRS